MTVPTIENGKKWLTCQLSVDEFDTLEEFCKKYNKTKTEAIRYFINNAEDYHTIMEAIKVRVRKKILNELADPKTDFSEVKENIKKIYKTEKVNIGEKGLPLVLPGAEEIEDDSYKDIFS